MTTQDVMIVLMVASVHLTLASLFDEMPKLKFWLLEEYRKLANGSYEYYLEIKGDRTKSPKKIAEARENATSHFLELDEILGMHASLTRKRNLFLGSWLTYVTICVTIHFSQKKEVAKIRRNRNARIRRENMRA